MEGEALGVAGVPGVVFRGEEHLVVPGMAGGQPVTHVADLAQEEEDVEARLLAETHVGPPLEVKAANDLDHLSDGLQRSLQVAVAVFGRHVVPGVGAHLVFEEVGLGGLSVGAPALEAQVAQYLVLAQGGGEELPEVAPMVVDQQLLSGSDVHHGDEAQLALPHAEVDVGPSAAVVELGGFDPHHQPSHDGGGTTGPGDVQQVGLGQAEGVAAVLPLLRRRLAGKGAQAEELGLVVEGQGVKGLAEPVVKGSVNVVVRVEQLVILLLQALGSLNS